MDFNKRFTKSYLNKKCLKITQEWEKLTFYYVKGSVYPLRSFLLHLWHGDIINRKYIIRQKILLENNFNPKEDIKINKDGIWEWSSDKPNLHKSVKDYFFERKEEVN